MNYGLVFSWNKTTQQVKLESGSPVYKDSVSVHKVTFLADLVLGNIVTVTFRYGSTPITTALTMGKVPNENKWEIDLPDIVSATSGTITAAFSILQPYTLNGQTRYKIVTTGNQNFTVITSTAQRITAVITPSQVENLQGQIDELAQYCQDQHDEVIDLVNEIQPFIGENGNWYVYDKETESMIDSGVHAQGVKGDTGDKGDTGATGAQGERGLKGEKGDKGDKGDTGAQGVQGEMGYPFEIKKIYQSIAEMNANFMTDLTNGEFAIIENGDTEDPDNSKLFMRNDNQMSFITDLSGSQGIRGLRGFSYWTTTANVTNLSTSFPDAQIGDYVANGSSSTLTILGQSTVSGGVIKSMSETTGMIVGNFKGIQGDTGEKGDKGDKGDTGEVCAHNDLSGIQGGADDDYYHITAQERADIGTIKSKLETVESGAQVNVLEGVQANGADLTIANKKVNITPTAIGAEPAIASKGTAFNKNFGTLADTICEGNDSRLSNSRPADGGNADTVDGKHASDFATAAQGALASSAYQKPLNGIPKLDLANDIQTSLGKADTALQPADVINNLTSADTAKPLSALQGKVLQETIAGKTFVKTFADISEMVANLNSAIATLYPSGYMFNIVTLDVPDFWVTEVMASSVIYTYTTDAALISAVQIAPLQIGYYKISLSETVKVDLTDYVQITRKINNKSLSEDITLTPTDVGAEPAFTKNDAFNKNFGTSAGTVCQGNDSRLSDARTPVAHTHGNADLIGLADWAKSPTKPTYTAVEVGAEPTFVKNTAFNKNFGSATGTVCEGNDSRLSNARPASDVSSWAKAASKPSYTASEVGAEPAISNKGTAFNKDFGSSGGTVCEGNDSRLSDARTPTAHNQDATTITTGTMDIARLPTITVAKGGTGATSAATARTNLGITPANISAATAAQGAKADSALQEVPPATNTVVGGWLVIDTLKGDSTAGITTTNGAWTRLRTTQAVYDALDEEIQEAILDVFIVEAEEE